MEGIVKVVVSVGRGSTTTSCCNSNLGLIDSHRFAFLSFGELGFQCQLALPSLPPTSIFHLLYISRRDLPNRVLTRKISNELDLLNHLLQTSCPSSTPLTLRDLSHLPFQIQTPCQWELTIVDFAVNSLAEQIQHIQGAELILATHGAALTLTLYKSLQSLNSKSSFGQISKKNNSVKKNPPLKNQMGKSKEYKDWIPGVIELIHPERYGNFHFENAAKFMGLDYVGRNVVDPLTNDAIQFVSDFLVIKLDQWRLQNP